MKKRISFLTKSILMTKWSNYTGTSGHDIVMYNLCKGLNKLGIDAAIGSFNLVENTTVDIKKVKLKKSPNIIPSGYSFDIIDNHETLLNFASLFTKVPFLFHYHGCSTKIQELNLRLSLSLCKKRILKIIAVSEPNFDEVKQSGIPSCIINNGVDTEFFKPNLNRPHVKGKPQLLYVGSLFKYKNIEKIISTMPEILKLYPSAHLQIVGEGNDHQRLYQLIKSQNLEKNVELVGKLNKEELRYRYSSCDVFVSATKLEAMELTPLEAMACGKPVALYETKIHKEFLISSKAGKVFSSDDSRTMSKVIIKVYEDRSFSSFARKGVEKNSWEQVCKKLALLYDEIL